MTHFRPKFRLKQLALIAWLPTAVPAAARGRSGHGRS